MTGVIQIELSEADALLFREFRRVQDTLKAMNDAGVFTTRNGKAILHFDDTATLQQITFDVVGWKRGKSNTQVAGFSTTNTL